MVRDSVKFLVDTMLKNDTELNQNKNKVLFQDREID